MLFNRTSASFAGSRLLTRALGLNKDASVHIIDLHTLIEDAGAAGHDVWTAGPASGTHIEALEAALNVQLPEAYRNFLQAVGALSINDSLVAGIIDGSPLMMEGGSLFGETLRSRGEQQLPADLFVLQPDGNAPYCFSKSTDGVFCYQVNTRSAKQIASSFEEWLRLFVFA